MRRKGKLAACLALAATLSVAAAAPAPAGAFPYTLKYLDTGSGVAVLQRALTDMGFAVGGVDGSFGPKTLAAVNNYQVAAGLPVTEVADLGFILSHPVAAPLPAAASRSPAR